jgi:hypothetical protein
MLTPNLRRSLIAVAISGLLLSAASAQNGSSRPEVTRDPFLNNQTVPGAAIQHHNTLKPGPGNGLAAPVQPTARKVPKVVAPAVDAIAAVPAPEVTVNGIVASSGQRQAILSNGSGSFIVQVGQKLSDYRVKAIDASSVTFEAQGHSFRIPLSKDV